MKVIFLDIDGVLNVCTRGCDRHGAHFHAHLVDNLKRIIDATDAKIVISSSWRMNGKLAMLDMWESRNLPGDVIDVTPNGIILELGEDFTRGSEIQIWLNANPVENYVILDDDTDFLSNQLSHFVQTSENTDHDDCVDAGYGLTSICADKAIEILNKK